ncbi:MAG TPA: serine hydrolase domain-containing protein [Mucilaginibacter sp.]|nr:serine hydrolase domain-containing protein [Mucilaginibacter sp.]
MKKTFLILLLGITIQPLFAQQKIIKKPDGGTITTDYIDQTVKKLMDTAVVTGLCIAVINDNKPAYIKTYGYKNKVMNQLNDTSTCFYAASLTKVVFAYIVVQLAQKGVIDLDKPLYTYLPKPIPEYDNYKELAGDDRWKLITARECLDHSTGFPNWRSDDQKMKIYFNPGTHYSYSGEGLMLLQLVVETITHRNLEDLAQEKVFNPLHMNRTSFVWQPQFETDYANGHGIEEDTIKKDRYKQPYGAGSMETTIGDYSRFAAGLMNKKGLTEKFWDEMFSPQIAINSTTQMFSLNVSDTTSANKPIELSYGLGVGLFKTPYGRAFFKEGHGFGWVHYMIAVPQQKTALIIMSNSASGESIFTELTQKLTGITIPYKWESYVPYRSTAKLSTEQLKQFEGVWEGPEYTATLKLVNGKLMGEAAKVHLPPTRFYTQNDHHLFLRIMEADFEFVKGPDGKFDKAIADDEGQHYELKRIK